MQNHGDVDLDQHPIHPPFFIYHSFSIPNADLDKKNIKVKIDTFVAKIFKIL